VATLIELIQCTGFLVLLVGPVAFLHELMLLFISACQVVRVSSYPKIVWSLLEEIIIQVLPEGIPAS